MLQKTDTPPHVRARRERSRRSKKRRRQGLRCWTLEIPDRAAAAMITALIATGKLTETEAKSSERVAQELARQLVSWARHWA